MLPNPFGLGIILRISFHVRPRPVSHTDKDIISLRHHQHWKLENTWNLLWFWDSLNFENEREREKIGTLSLRRVPQPHGVTASYHIMHVDCDVRTKLGTLKNFGIHTDLEKSRRICETESKRDMELDFRKMSDKNFENLQNIREQRRVSTTFTP